MKAIRYFFVFILTILASFSYAENIANQNSPVGYWKTIDDVTGQQKSIVRLWQEPNGKLYGRILKIWPSAGHDQHELCEKCTGSRHNQQIVGMIFLENLEQNKNDPSLWQNGSILDPKNGKVYRSQIRVIDNGQKLNVRGYVGLPLFGRTQTWLRVGGI